MDYCRVTYDLNRINVTSRMADDGDNVNNLIEHDKKYAIMKPRNGKYFTFRIIDTQDGEVTDRMLNRAVKYAWKAWTLRLNIDVKQAKAHEAADFTVKFRTPENDERKIMTRSTIMYHYMPISDFNHPLRGLCVINPNFYYTANGNPVPLHVIDPVHYPTPTKRKGTTIDLDNVLKHEFGHGLGLSHDPTPGSTMSTPYDTISERLSERDVYRGIKKYGMKYDNLFVRKLKWLWHRSEHY